MTQSAFTKAYFRLPRAEIAYLRFTLESYDGLAFQRTLDSATGLVEIIWPTERSRDVELLLTALAAEIDWCEVAPPEVIPPL